MVDTLSYVRALEAAGVSRDQAEAQVTAMALHVLPDLTTKSDLTQLRAELRADINSLRVDFQKAMYDLTWRMLGVTITVVGLADAVLFVALHK